jgi:hypothetical protein
MSTPQEATELNPTAWENAPVVIKTGGGQTGGETDPPAPLTMQCTISIPDEPPGKNLSFRSTLLEDQWQSAKSDQHASITSVVIDEMGKPRKTITPDPTGLAVLQISYGTETLIVQEVELPDNDVDTKLSITSSRPFLVTDSVSDTEWRDSETDVPAENPFVVFTKGGTSDETRCVTTNVTITINVEWGNMPPS